MFTKQKIIELIQSLIRLGDTTRNPNIHEAKSALEKVKQLARKYSINLNDLGPETYFGLGNWYTSTLIEKRYTVAGFQYHEGPLHKYSMSVGDEVILKPEPENPFDHNAIAIFWNNIKIGYIPRVKTNLVRKFMKNASQLFGNIVFISKEKSGWGAIEIELSNNNSN